MFGSQLAVALILTSSSVILLSCLEDGAPNNVDVNLLAAAKTWKDLGRQDRDELPTSQKEIELRLREDKIIPDMISQAPKDVLKVDYKSGAKINFGELIRNEDTSDPPENITWPAVDGDYYTLLLTNRDAAMEIPPIAPEWQHWMIVNILGKDWQNGDVRTAYLGAFVPNWLTYDTGPHRYVFTLWRQKYGMTRFRQKFIHNLIFDLRRTNFSTPLFSDKYNLELIAINYFRSDWHEMPHDRETLLRSSTPITPQPTIWY